MANGNGIRLLAILTALAAPITVSAAEVYQLGIEIQLGKSCAELLSIKEKFNDSSAAKQRARIAAYQYSLKSHDHFNMPARNKGARKARSLLNSQDLATQVTLCKVYAKEGIKPLATVLELD